MPGLSGIEATRAIIARLPKTAVVILSMYSSTELVQEALSAGARGYLLKGVCRRRSRQGGPGDGHGEAFPRGGDH